MNAKEFNKYKTALYKKYGAELTDFSHEVKVHTNSIELDTLKSYLERKFLRHLEQKRKSNFLN